MATKKKEVSNSIRFINAYNTIDYAIRIQHSFKRSMSFSDIIRRAVPLNYIVRKYEDDLIDYGRLRNAIIHRSNDSFVIAEPHDDVVESIEHIASIISTPPKAIDAVRDRNVLCVQYDVIVKDVIELISTSAFSNIPVYKNGGLIGVANGQRILDHLGEIIAADKNVDDYISSTKIEDILTSKSTSTYYEVASKDATIEEVLNLFYKNRKLVVVILTKDGSLNETPIGIITTTDVMEMNYILENY